jgi:hypothetical protein
MNPRILAVPLLAAIAACVWFFVAEKRYIVVVTLSVPADAGNTVQSALGGEKNSAAENSPPSSAEMRAVNWKHFAALMNGDAAAIPQPTEEDIARFLAKHGETAANLVVAFEITRDRRLLERALELFPNSSVVVMAAVESVPSPAPKPGETYRPDAQRMAFIEHFKATDPNNPLPWIFSAQELFKAGRTNEAVAEIRTALERPAFYTYATERMDSAQQLYEELGLHPAEAGFVAMAGLTLPHMGAAQQASRSLMEWQQSAAQSGDIAAADDARRLTYNLGRTFATPEASRNLVGQLVGINMEGRALKSLPADAQRDWLPVAPAQRLAEMEKQAQNVKELVATSDWLYRSEDEQLLAEYLRRNREDGELSALTWLKTQKK